MSSLPLDYLEEIKCATPDCRHPRRMNSKYCSDECARKTYYAKKRTLRSKRIADRNPAHKRYEILIEHHCCQWPERRAAILAKRRGVSYGR